MNFNNYWNYVPYSMCAHVMYVCVYLLMFNILFKVLLINIFNLRFINIFLNFYVIFHIFFIYRKYSFLFIVYGHWGRHRCSWRIHKGRDGFRDVVAAFIIRRYSGCSIANLHRAPWPHQGLLAGKFYLQIIGLFSEVFQ